jgi:hypothetical protein
VVAQQREEAKILNFGCLWWRPMSHKYREPISCLDRDLNRIDLAFRLPYLADLVIKSPKIKTAKVSRAPARRGEAHAWISTDHPCRCLAPAPAPFAPARRGVVSARVWCFIFPPPSHSLEEWRQLSYLCWSSHFCTRFVPLSLAHMDL